MSIKSGISALGRIVKSAATGGITGAAGEIAAIIGPDKFLGVGDAEAGIADTIVNGVLKRANPIKVQKVDLPNAALVILNRDGSPSNQIIRFQTPPRTIQDAKTANFDSQNILGRSEPIRAYTSSNARTISFSVNYYWYDYSGVGSWTSIERNLNLLKSLVYPRYKAGYSPAPKILFSFGKVYRGVPCIVKSVSLELKDPWINPDGNDPRDGDVVPFQTVVNIALEVAYDYHDARGQKQISLGKDTASNSKHIMYSNSNRIPIVGKGGRA